MLRAEKHLELKARNSGFCIMGENIRSASAMCVHTGLVSEQADAQGPAMLARETCKLSKMVFL